MTTIPKCFFYDLLSALSQLAARVSTRGLIQRQVQLANVYIIGLLHADYLTRKISQFDSHQAFRGITQSLSQIQHTACVDLYWQCI